MKKSCLVCCAVGAAVLSLFSGAALAVPPAVGTYQLHNHPDGNVNPPPYGLRLDELYNPTTNSDIFTFNFDAALSNMRMDYNGSTIHIYGTAMGGRDIGGSYAADVYNGLYTIDFLYTWGVGTAPGDDDLLVDPGTHYNYGTIQGPAGTGGVISLRDGHYGDGQPDFRFGNEDNDLGHRGFAGLSGWGWLFHQVGGPNGTYQNVASDDWLFTATLVPTPGTALLVGLGGLMAGSRRRR